MSDEKNKKVTSSIILNKSTNPISRFRVNFRRNLHGIGEAVKQKSLLTDLESKTSPSLDEKPEKLSFLSRFSSRRKYLKVDTPPPQQQKKPVKPTNFAKRVEKFFKTFTNPNKIAAQVWVFITFFISCYNLFVIPFRVSLLYEWYQSWPKNVAGLVVWFVIDFLLDIVMLIDLALQFITPYLGPDGMLVFEWRKISKHYVGIRGWFKWDFLSCLPIDWILTFIFPKYAAFFRLNRMLRLVRIPNYFNFMDSYVDFLNATKIQIFKFLLYFFWAEHIITCIWFEVIYWEGEEIAAEFTEIEDLRERNIIFQYQYGFYWVWVTTNGMGGTVPTTVTEIFFSMFTLVAGVVMFVVVIGTVNNLVANKDSAAAKARRKMDEIDDYMKYRKLSKPLQEKIRNYYNFLWKSRKGWDENQILESLPPYLRMELALQLNRKIIEKVPLFRAKGVTKTFISAVVMNLVPRVTLPGAKIVTRGEIGREMYFISSGTVEVIGQDDETVVATLVPGNFFWRNCPHLQYKTNSYSESQDVLRFVRVYQRVL